jgi:hypothetical protein
MLTQLHVRQYSVQHSTHKWLLSRGSYRRNVHDTATSPDYATALPTYCSLTLWQATFIHLRGNNHSSSTSPPSPSWSSNSRTVYYKTIQIFWSFKTVFHLILGLAKRLYFGILYPCRFWQSSDFVQPNCRFQFIWQPVATIKEFPINDSGVPVVYTASCPGCMRQQEIRTRHLPNTTRERCLYTHPLAF